MSYFPGWLRQEWVFALPEPNYALCLKAEAFCGLGLEGFFIHLTAGLGFFAKCGSESGMNPRGASLLDITAVFLPTLSVLS